MNFIKKLKLHVDMANLKTLPKEYRQQYDYKIKDIYQMTPSSKLHIICPVHGLFTEIAKNHVITNRGTAPRNLKQCKNCKIGGKMSSKQSKYVLDTLNIIGYNFRGGSDMMSEQLLDNIICKNSNVTTSVDGIDYIRNIVMEYNGGIFHGWSFRQRSDNKLSYVE